MSTPVNDVVEVTHSIGDVVQAPARHEAPRVIWTMHPGGGPGSKVVTVTELNETGRRITVVTYAAAWVVRRLPTQREGGAR